MWSGDGRTLFYVSDRSGHQNLWAHPLGGTPRPLTRFTSGRVLWPSASGDGHTIVFERDFSIWTLDTASGKTAAIPVTRRGVPTGPAVEHLGSATQIQELALSPDGKKVAFVVHGEVFAASAKDGGDAARVTRSAGNEAQVMWAPDSRRVAYASDRDGVIHLFLYDFTTGAETRLTQGARDDAWPQFSPDGKRLAFLRGQEELRVLEIEAARNACWPRDISPTGWRAAVRWHGRPTGSGWPCSPSAPRDFVTSARRSGRRRRAEAPCLPCQLVRFERVVEPRRDVPPVRHGPADRAGPARAHRPHASRAQAARGPVPRAVPGRDPEDADARVVQARRPTLRRRRHPPAALPVKTEPGGATPVEAKKPAAPVEIVFDRIRRRLTQVPVGVDVGQHAVSPDGKWVLLTAQAAGQTNLYTYSLDELSRERPVARQLTSTGGVKSFAQFTPDSKEVYYLEDGRIQVVTLERREPRPLAVSAEMDVDFAEEKLEVFQQAWTYQRDSFFDPAFNGADWNAVRQQYLPHARGAATSDELRRVISLMVGELNASHLGISGPGTPSPTHRPPGAALRPRRVRAARGASRSRRSSRSVRRPSRGG